MIKKQEQRWGHDVKKLERWGHDVSSGALRKGKEETKFEFWSHDVLGVNRWINMYGNPSYVITYVDPDNRSEMKHIYLVDDFGGKNDISLPIKTVQRRKDLLTLPTTRRYEKWCTLDEQAYSDWIAETVYAE